MSFGPWMLGAFRLLAKFKFLRGTPLDPFGLTAERKTERQLVRDYEALLDELIAKLAPENHHIAVGLAAIPKKSAASATSSSVTSKRPKPTKPRCWSNSARAPRPSSKPRSDRRHRPRSPDGAQRNPGGLPKREQAGPGLR